MSDKLIKVGQYNTKYNDILGVDLPELDIYRDQGLIGHLIKRKHFEALKYIDSVPDIINNPDYIGINPNEKDKSFEVVKRLKHNIMLGIKLESNGAYYYVSTIHQISKKSLDSLQKKDRLKQLDNKR